LYSKTSPAISTLSIRLDFVKRIILLLTGAELRGGKEVGSTKGIGD
jgi:hypothetical protein